MKKQKDIVWFPSQLALVLGTKQTDILQWINNGNLKAEKYGHVIKICENDLVSFLKENPECAGRVYCDDLMSSPYSKARARIVSKLEG